MTDGKKQAVTLAVILLASISLIGCNRNAAGTVTDSKETTALRERIAALEAKNVTMEREILSLRAQLTASKPSAANATPPPRDSKGFSTNPVTAAAEKKVGKETRTYLVQKGDTLSTIAFQFYKNKKRWTDIADANQNALSGSTTVRPGQTLIIP